MIVSFLVVRLGGIGLKPGAQLAENAAGSKCTEPSDRAERFYVARASPADHHHSPKHRQPKVYR
jgi:hypothetical protein